MVKNVNRTARLQWKVDTIKNCIYLQCTLNSNRKFEEVNTYRIQCMGKGVNMKVKEITHFSANTINCVCHNIRSMFRILGIYYFDYSLKRETRPKGCQKIDFAVKSWVYTSLRPFHKK